MAFRHIDIFLHIICYIRDSAGKLALSVELAFEDHRAWDVRRWNVAEKALARPIYGMEVTKENGKFVYTRKVAQNRVFTEKMYLYPIPEGEVWKTNIENNPGWNN